MAAVDGQSGADGAVDHTVHLLLDQREQVVGEVVETLGRVVDDPELVHAVAIHVGEDVI